MGAVLATGRVTQLQGNLGGETLVVGGVQSARSRRDSGLSEVRQVWGRIREVRVCLFCWASGVHLFGEGPLSPGEALREPSGPGV